MVELISMRCRHPAATLDGFTNTNCDHYHPKKHDSLYSADWGGRMDQSGSIMVIAIHGRALTRYSPLSDAGHDGFLDTQ